MPDSDQSHPYDVDVIVEDARWSDLERLAQVAVPAALVASGLTGSLEVAVLGCDDARIATLNADFRGKPQPTNVLSWPSEERDPDTPPDDTELGDIAIAFDTCAREAAEQGKPFDAHVIHLLVHATLHLLGHDHIDEEEAMRMEALEVRIVTALGFSDPYLSAMDEGSGSA
ncbi:rRNA maturation RNase YbeY [Jannaschia pohangensis]|uniref:Endoribonuclease YbeY n=1 Tax=Jannaschia pohangensis TaxID=390807 RepID=A0A1I3LR27_9RHOB|nr:rRNA maturation RNase YbeY [Jannaschia pohangensis]SFI87177.1 probable rRNA maturation factor [Jannaschia pohangensis]